MYDLINIAGAMCHIDNNNGVNVHGHVTLDKEAAKELGQGLSVIGSSLGLGATIAGVSSAVAKGLFKSGMPPVQKAGIILGAGLIGGLSHTKLTAMNRNSILLHEGRENIRNEGSTDLSDLHSSVNKLIDDGIQSSPLQDLLLNLEITNYVCLSLMGILLIQILFKFYIQSHVTLPLSNLLGNNFNNKLEYYINKIIILNQKMSTIYI
jgi:hypothetical protein